MKEETIKCVRCNKKIDINKVYFAIGTEVGDRNNKKISRKIIKKLDLIEEQKDRNICNTCGMEFCKLIEVKDKIADKIEEFFKLAD